MEITLEVASSTKTENGNFCNKLVAQESVSTVFGNATTRQTYYLFTDQENKEGTSGKMDLSAFDIVEKPWTSDDGESMTLKYIYPKR